MTSGRHANPARTMLRKLRCVSSAPFGVPVDPDVYTMVARSSAPTDAIRASSSSSETATPRPSSAPSALPSSMRMRCSVGQLSITESRRS